MSDLDTSERAESGAAIFAGVASICVLLLALALLQPDAASWIAQSAATEYGSEPDTTPPMQLAQAKHRPIAPGAWGESFGGRTLEGAGQSER
jgi:hypothetical protein